jgi:hypothetical protein
VYLFRVPNGLILVFHWCDDEFPKLYGCKCKMNVNTKRANMELVVCKQEGKVKENSLKREWKSLKNTFPDIAYPRA